MLLFEIQSKCGLLCNARLWVSGTGDGHRMQAISFRLSQRLSLKCWRKNNKKKTTNFLHWRPFGECGVVMSCAVPEQKVTEWIIIKLMMIVRCSVGHSKEYPDCRLLTWDHAVFW